MQRRVRIVKRLAAGIMLLAAVSTSAEEPAQTQGILVPISFSAWEKKVAGYPPEIVVVDLWATWCSTCLVRFPKMVKLYEKYRAAGVRFVSLCLDDREDTRALIAAERFLQLQNAPFEHFLMDERLDLAFEKLDLLGIPVVLVYGRNGAEAARLTGDDPNDQFDEQDVEAAIERALATAAKPAV